MSVLSGKVVEVVRVVYKLSYTREVGLLYIYKSLWPLYVNVVEPPQPPPPLWGFIC